MTIVSVCVADGTIAARRRRGTPRDSLCHFLTFSLCLDPLLCAYYRVRVCDVGVDGSRAGFPLSLLFHVMLIFVVHSLFGVVSLSSLTVVWTGWCRFSGHRIDTGRRDREDGVHVH